VLAGEIGQRDRMLASPIILYDYPQVAPESSGDWCDGAEIDEMLMLRVLTLTADEKRAMRDVDRRAREILERTEALSEDQMLKLHGAFRGLERGAAARCDQEARS
jgi:hydrogenase maturation protease